MAGDLGLKMQQNWIKLKDRLSARWRHVADICFQKGLLDFEDRETIRCQPIDGDKIEIILMKVVKLDQCEWFIDILQECGFGDLCKEIRNTVISQGFSDHYVPSIVMTRVSVPNKRMTRDESNFTLDKVYNRLDQVDKKAEEREAKRDQKMKEMIDQMKQELSIELVKAVEKIEPADVRSSIKELETKYEDLRIAYAKAPSNIEVIGISIDEKTRETNYLREQIKLLENEIQKLKQNETNKELLTKKTHELEELKTKYEALIKEVRKLNSDKEQMNKTITDHETHLNELNDELQKLRIENEDLKSKDQTKVLKQIKFLMGKFEFLERERQNEEAVFTMQTPPWIRRKSSSSEK